MGKSILNGAVGALLKTMAAVFNNRKKYNAYLYTTDGPVDFTVGFKTETGTVDKAIRFRDGRAQALKTTPEERDVVLRFRDDRTLFEMLTITPNEMMALILDNRMIMDGNVAYLELFNYFIALLMGRVHAIMHKRRIKEDNKERVALYGDDVRDCTGEIEARKRGMLKAETRDSGVKYLPEPYLSEYAIEDFPRLQGFLDRHFTIKPQICPERPAILTKWFRENGFEKDKDGKPWDPALRQGYSYKYLMENRKPIIAENELIAGTTTAKQPVGVVIYPDAQGTMIWGELKSLSDRLLNPYDISEEDAAVLHDVFTFWAKRNFREYVRAEHGNPLCQQIDERWVFYFCWKSVGISHTIPDYDGILARGTLDYMRQIDERMSRPDVDEEKRNVLKSMRLVLEGVNAYALNLSREAYAEAAETKDAKRRAELERIGEICAKIPMNPCTSLDEAVNCMWIIWVCLHMENTNAGLSIGRVDQFLQPYFEMDMKRASGEEERKELIKRAIELCGCFYMRCTDHLPLVPDIGNYLFGGSSSDQAITLGGVDEDGNDAVCDMTYILLKVTEMLSIRDPNVNARFNEKNSATYLRRLCEVNYVTAATPSMHSDSAVMKCLLARGYPEREINRWTATGCVEPTLSGRHMGHTGSILMNMVAPFEMAMNDGVHPGMHWQLGPHTGKVEDFKTFDEFYEAYKTQQKFIIENAIQFNNWLADAHARYRPSPLLSVLMDDCIENAKDCTRGGARFNSSGSSNIGLADVTDSMLVIKKLVFDDKKMTFAELKKAVDADFKGYESLQSYVRNKIPLFGSGDREAIAMANDIAGFIHGVYASHTDYRGGRYTSGFWSMSQHVCYGNLSGALPSGRQAGKAFTPGLTPQTFASKNFLDNIRDVAKLDPVNMDNNEAFNVRLVPSASDSREKIVDTMAAYVRTYFDCGGMQMQFNVVNSDTLKDAMAHPENYRNLLVRISGYNAYFVTLNRQMQIELIERTEFGI